MAINLALNYWAVLVAAIASFVLGGLWYGPLFGKTWQKWMGYSTKDLKSMKLTAAKAMTLGFVVTLIASYVMANFVSLLSVVDAMGAFQLAFWGWLGFCMPINIGAYLWEKRPFKLFILNGAHRFLELLVMALILGYWH